MAMRPSRTRIKLVFPAAEFARIPSARPSVRSFTTLVAFTRAMHEMNGCRLAWLIVLLCCVLISGCAKKSNRGTVAGNVSLDDQPIKMGVIRFVPVDGQTATADAAIADGKFTAEMPPGEKRISI